MTSERFPLSWPVGWKRTPKSDRKHARFASSRSVPLSSGQGSYRQAVQLTTADAVSRIGLEMRRLGVVDGDWLISSNVEVRLYWLPYSNRTPPADVGVAVYFRLSGKDRVLACDTWDRVADNIAAVAAHVECIRAIDRYGVGTLDQAFAGYKALPAPKSNWRSALGFGADAAPSSDQIHEAYRSLARRYHPDAPDGNHEAFVALESAKRDALMEVGQ